MSTARPYYRRSFFKPPLRPLLPTPRASPDTPSLQCRRPRLLHRPPLTLFRNQLPLIARASQDERHATRRSADMHHVCCCCCCCCRCCCCFKDRQRRRCGAEKRQSLLVVSVSVGGTAGPVMRPCITRTMPFERDPFRLAPSAHGMEHPLLTSRACVLADKRALPRWRYNLRQQVLPLIRWETPYLSWMQEKLRTPALDSYFAITANLGTHTFFMIGLPICFWCGWASLGKG